MIDNGIMVVARHANVTQALRVSFIDSGRFASSDRQNAARVGAFIGPRSYRR